MPTVTPAGEFRDCVTFLAPTESTNDTGESIEAYADAATVAASIKPLTMRETVRARAAQVESTHRIIIRYREDVRSTWRVKWQDPRGVADDEGTRWRTANILGIVETVRRRELELSVVEVTDE